MLLLASVNRQFTANHVSAYLPGSPLCVRVRRTDFTDYFGPDAVSLYARYYVAGISCMSLEHILDADVDIMK
jgi:hypothetical protein